MSQKHHIWLTTSILMLLSVSGLGQSFKDDSPRYNYDTLPKTSFSCQGKFTGRYYADAETDCQLFHVCVKMSARDTHDFKFLCPNGTTFDQEHQVCMDYYQVVCHEGIGTNPLGHIYELMKLSSGSRDAGLDAGKVSFIDPDVAERNTLGDDFQVDEYNNNRLATSQNALNYQSSKQSRKPSQDIFYKSFASTKYTTSTTTPRTTTTTRSTTSAPLIFRSPIPTNEPSRSTPASQRRPSLETFESYETESIAGLNAQNSFNQGNLNPKYYEDSYEIRDPEPSTSTSTTSRPTDRQVFHNTFRTSFADKSSTAIPPAQTFQQQASRFNDDFFRKLPASTETSVSKAAQFYINSNTNYYSTPEVRQPTTNPFFRGTTEFPSTTRQSYFVSSTPRSTSTSAPRNSGFQYENNNNTPEPFRRTPTTTTEEPIHSRQFYSTKTNDRGLSNRGSSTFPASSVYTSTTSAPQGIAESSRQNKFFVHPQSQSPSDEYNRPKSFSSKIVSQSTPEDVIRPRSFSGTTNVNHNQVNRQSNRENFGFSTIPPPTTAEPHTAPTTTSEPFYQSEVTNNKANTYFQRITTLKPEKFSIFFSKATTYANKEYTEKETRFPTSGASTTVDFYEPTSTYRPQTTRRNTPPVDYQPKSNSRTRNFENSYISSTTEFSFPESTTTTTTTTTIRPLRRGARRRISRPRQEPPKKFDPAFKYSRRVESSLTNEKNEKETYSQKNEEIFSAQASVFPARPEANLFHENRKEVKDAVEETKRPASENSPKLAENFGRRIRPNTRREQFIRTKIEDVPSAPVVEDQPQQSQAPRRLVKRIKVKPTTSAPDNYVPTASSTTVRPSTSTTTTTTTTTAAPPSFPTSYSSSAFPFDRSTLRPVTRINVKTKIANRKFDKDSEFQTAPSFQSNKNPFLAFEKSRRVSTTEEPELITASEDDILKRKLKKFSAPFGTKDITTPITDRPVLLVNEKKNSTSSVVIKVTTKSQQQPFPTPISFKEPILSKFDKKESRVEVKTKNSDYDYIYYNTDDDYKDESSLLVQEQKNYGKKPIKKALPEAA